MPNNPTTSTPSTTQVVSKNNGSVSCQTYCAGTENKPWNNELPVEWNGAKCISTGISGVSCDQTYGSPINCTCAPTGTGWANAPNIKHVVFGNNSFI